VIAARYQSEGRAEEYTIEQNTFRLLWPSGKHITPKLRAFIDFVVEYVNLRTRFNEATRPPLRPSLASSPPVGWTMALSVVLNDPSTGVLDVLVLQHREDSVSPSEGVDYRVPGPAGPLPAFASMSTPRTL
jgi:hypothetical protein